MAEAHQAVAFQFQVTHDGVNINYDSELLHAVWLSGVRSWRNRFSRFANNFKNGIYPSSVELLVSIQLLTFLLVFGLHKDPSLGLIDQLARVVPRVVACTMFASILFLMKTLFMRYSLKLLLIYKGWMYESRSRTGPSRRTRVWVFLIRVLTAYKSPALYSYQASLPRLPLPRLDQTIERYLRSVRPLLDDDKYQRMTSLAEDFKRGVGRKFQRYLWLKSWWSTNYVSDWWEEFVYLRGRAPLMVNSNFYGIDALIEGPTNKQSARAANLTYASLLFRKQIDRQELKPIMVQNLVPLCSNQYERMFNTTRVPHKECDELRHVTDSPHVTVLHEGKFYKLQIHHRGRLLQPRELQKQFQKIIDDDQQPSDAERHLAALTAMRRDEWAEVRHKFFGKGLNRISLAAIENSAFVVVLESRDFDYHQKLDEYGQLLLHGRGDDRWFDKSFNLIVAKNGRVGFNAEHSWADAPIVAHLWEYALHMDFSVLKYTEEGDCLAGSDQNGRNGTAEYQSAAIRLKWELDDHVTKVIDRAFSDAQCLLNDVDLKLFRHNFFGKGFIKKCSVSPDAFIQMALQLAYKRDQGHLSLTYEASMTRLYREGRTETVRPVTVESKKFIDSMTEDIKCPREERIRLLRVACQRHQRGYQEAMCGKGVDRHLFCLYVISKYLEAESPFLREVLSEPWRLSTSQTPHGQVGLLDKTSAVSAGGGFGPVADDGYGVSYIVAGEHEIFFHISSKKSSPKTDSERFREHVRRALKDMRSLFSVDS